MELVDGFPDMTTEMQEKIMRALEQGHVDDSDWKHGTWDRLRSCIARLTMFCRP